MRQRSTVPTIATYAALGVFGITMLIPFLWMVSASLKLPEDIKGLNMVPRTTVRELDRDGEWVEVEEVAHKIEVHFPDGIPDVKEGIIVTDAEKGIGKIDATDFRQTRDGGVALIGGQQFRADKRDEYVRVRILATDERLNVSPDAIRVKSWVDPKWGNYKEAWYAFEGKVDTKLLQRLLGVRLPFDLRIRTGFLMAYINSILVAVAATLGQVLTCSMAAFAFSRLRFRGRDYLFFGYLATMMIPAAVTLVPVFMLMKWLNWFDTYKVLILPAMFSAYGTFLLRQFFMTLPHELEEAAKIDGAGFFRIYWQIALPLSKPALATLATFTFIGSWRSFLWPLLVLNDPNMHTLPMALREFQTRHGTDWHLMMAASVIALIPIIIVFLFNQRFFVEGVKLSGMKG